jgi:hypothetical protein
MDDHDKLLAYIFLPGTGDERQEDHLQQAFSIQAADRREFRADEVIPVS